MSYINKGAKDPNSSKNLKEPHGLLWNHLFILFFACSGRPVLPRLAWRIRSLDADELASHAVIQCSITTWHHHGRCFLRDKRAIEGREEITLNFLSWICRFVYTSWPGLPAWKSKVPKYLDVSNETLLERFVQRFEKGIPIICNPRMSQPNHHVLLWFTALIENTEYLYVHEKKSQSQFDLGIKYI